ncbi:MAG TPA: pyridoxal-phosphate dependent enzyme, partial [Nitrosospira sp.]|nr:pyridoxal-phosphate dependent enzyme [Nitrosospira sp.]
MPLHIETPLIESPSISHKVGQSIWLKMESAQPSGSFKTRGIGYAC